MMPEFKPNIYPIIYWGLMYGLIAGFLLFVMMLLSRYITTIWFPVFLAGVIWGGYRNYKKQKGEWTKQTGQPGDKQPLVEEVKAAATDIYSATKDMLTEQAEETKSEEEPREKKGSEV
jgi:hypothetical protein